MVSCESTKRQAMNLTTLWREFFSGQPLWLKTVRAFSMVIIGLAYGVWSLLYLMLTLVRR
jgi:hypothetical protein